MSTILHRDGRKVTYTDSCSGCFEPGDYCGNVSNYQYDSKAGCYLGSGCSECGYTGKRRWTIWVPDLENEAQ